MCLALVNASPEIQLYNYCNIRPNQHHFCGPMFCHTQIIEKLHASASTVRKIMSLQSQATHSDEQVYWVKTTTKKKTVAELQTDGLLCCGLVIGKFPLKGCTVSFSLSVEANWGPFLNTPSVQPHLTTAAPTLISQAILLNLMSHPWYNLGQCERPYTTTLGQAPSPKIFPVSNDILAAISVTSATICRKPARQKQAILIGWGACNGGLISYLDHRAPKI